MPMKSVEAGKIVVAPDPFRRDSDRCVALGISTGGPPALATVFAALRPPLPPIVIVQHMPAQFTKSFAERLNGLSALTVKEAEHGERPLPDHAYIAPGGRHLGLERRGATIRLVVRDGEPVSGHRPSVDVLMTDAARFYGERCLGVIMTGMGRDGAAGCAAIRAAGGTVLGQDQASSDVYGMNKVAFVEGHVDRQFSLDDAAQTLMREARAIGRKSSTPTVCSLGSERS
ncbi:MAG: CheB methylesterase domain-containing protein [Pirellulales bacterium]